MKKNGLVAVRIAGICFIAFGIGIALFSIVSKPTATVFPRLSRYAPVVSGLLNVVLGLIVLRSKPEGRGAER
jgi:hypothetical protein